MAINFAGLLGGLGVGAQQLAAQREQERQFNINRQFAERQFAESQLGRQQQYELQKAAAERADALAERQSKELRNKELGLANQSVVSLLSADLQDEEKALEELRQPGLSPADIEGIRERRRKRRKVVEDALASFDKMSGYSDLFGSAFSRLQASPVAGVEPLKVTPKVNWTQYFDKLDAARKTIASVAPDKQQSEWATQAAILAKGTGASMEEVEQKLPRPGTGTGVFEPSTFNIPSPEGVIPQPKTGAEDWLANINRIRSEFGQAPTQLQEVKGKEIPFQYSSPERDALLTEAQRLQNEERRLLMDSKFKAAIEDVNTKRLRNILTQKQIDWYDRIQAANIASKAARVAVQKAQAAAKAGTEKGISLADQVRMFSAESLNAYRDNQTWLATEKMRQTRIGQLSGEISKLETLANAAEVKAAESADKAMKNVQSASLKVAESLRAQAKALRQQLDHISNGNAAGMAAYTGSSLGAFNPATASSAGLASFLQGGQARIQSLMQTGVQGMQSGMQGQQPQGQGGTVVNLGGISIGGGQPAAGMVGPNGQPLNFNDPATLMAMIQAFAGKGGMADYKPTPEITMGRWDELRKVFPNLTDNDIKVYLKPDGSLVPEGKTLLTALNKRKGEALRKGATKFAEDVQKSGGLFGRKPEPNRVVPTPRSQPVFGGSGPALN